MTLRRWAPVAACMLVFVAAASAQAQGNGDKSDRQQQNTQTEQSKPIISQTPVSRPSIQTQAADKRPAEAEIYQPDCRKPKNQPDADLCTQGRVADAAEKALQYTLAQTLIGALGVFFVVVTLGFTARANKAAAIAAQAAVDAVGAERAWISFIEFQKGSSKGSGWINDVEYKRIDFFWLVFRNTGRSPAVNVKAYRAFRLVDPDEEVSKFSIDEELGHGAVIGPDVAVNTQPAAIGDVEVAAFRERRKHISLYAYITYETTTAPGIKRSTEVCGRLIYNGERISGLGQIDANINFSLDGPQNTAT